MDHMQKHGWDLEICIQSEVSQKEKKQIYIINNTYMWNPEQWYRWSYLQNKIETQTQRINIRTWWGDEDGLSWKTEPDIYSGLCIRQITNENLLYSTENCP